MGEVLLELWSFMKEQKKFWMLPIIICLVLLGSLIVFTSGFHCRTLHIYSILKCSKPYS